MDNLRTSKTRIDLEKFGYLIAYRLRELGISTRVAQGICGVTASQISHAQNGMPIHAGATYVLCQFLEIDMRELLLPDIQEKLRTIENYKQQQGVALDDKRETRQASPNDAPLMQATP